MTKMKNILKSTLLSRHTLCLGILSFFWGAYFYADFKVQHQPCIANNSSFVKSFINSDSAYNDKKQKISIKLTAFSGNSISYNEKSPFIDPFLKKNNLKMTATKVGLPFDNGRTLIYVKSSLLNQFYQIGKSHGINSYLLLTLAYHESRFNPNISNGSAVGIFQFQPQTWLSSIFEYGALDSNLAPYVQYIKQNNNGTYSVIDNKENEVLNLRKNSRDEISMAAYSLLGNKATIENSLNVKATNTDIVLSHVLGVNGAIKLIKAIKDKPNSKTSSVIPYRVMTANGFRQQSVLMTYNDLNEKYINEINAIKVAFN
jgi:hypothetical protein